MENENKKSETNYLKGFIGVLGLLGFGVLVFYFVTYLLSGEEKTCGCGLPNVSIPNYAKSWDDKKENWEFKECAIAESKENTEKIHIYVYYNHKIEGYRCQLKYSWPGQDCRGYSKTFGENAISTADISTAEFNNGEWKKFDYWMSREYLPK
jgi:hypothetical protein